MSQYVILRIDIPIAIKWSNNHPTLLVEDEVSLHVVNVQGVVLIPDVAPLGPNDVKRLDIPTRRYLEHGRLVQNEADLVVGIAADAQLIAFNLDPLPMRLRPQTYVVMRIYTSKKILQVWSLHHLAISLIVVGLVEVMVGRRCCISHLPLFFTVEMHQCVIQIQNQQLLTNARFIHKSDVHLLREFL